MGKKENKIVPEERVRRIAQRRKEEQESNREA